VPVQYRRLVLIKALFLAAFLALAVRFFSLQVISREFYAEMADGQHGILEQLFPNRGSVYLTDPESEDGLFPAAVNRPMKTAWARPSDIADPPAAARALAPVLGVDEVSLYERLSKTGDPYEVLRRRIDDETAAAVSALGIGGVNFFEETFRYYPEGSDVGQVVGFVGSDDAGKKVGRYGIEGYWNEELAGQPGILVGSRDPVGRLIGTGDTSIRPARDGADLVLSIDHAVQYVVCRKLRAAVEQYRAEDGSAVVMDPETGAVIAMCSVPSFDSNEYSSVGDLSLFNNRATFVAYEPGSVFKPIVMAAAVDAGKVRPNSTFDDDGDVVIGDATIRNSTLKAYGRVTMTDVLVESLNTGMVHLATLLGPGLFRDYVTDFGFGSRTGIDLDTEVGGDVSALQRPGKIWSATASFGQGITVTPLQLAVAYSAIANGGRVVEPHVVKEVRRAGSVEKTETKVRRQVISRRAATLVSGMLVQVVEAGHGKRAAVPGYWVAGKTGTAQIAGDSGYEENAHIGSFAGFAPVDKPAFVLVVKISRPQGVDWAEQSAAPLFGEIAEFLLKYMQIPPERPL
jgi:cell division protein FtsI/penicillin-binding protein 2